MTRAVCLGANPCHSPRVHRALQIMCCSRRKYLLSSVAELSNRHYRTLTSGTVVHGREMPNLVCDLPKRDVPE